MEALGKQEPRTEGLWADPHPAALPTPPLPG